MEISDFEIECPEGLTKEVYIQVIKKVYGLMRHHAYPKIQEKLKATGKDQLNEEELHEITDKLESDKFRDQALKLYEV